MSSPGPGRRHPIRHLLGAAAPGEPVELTGWVKTSRFSKNVSFVHIYDGSTTRTVQAVLAADQASRLRARLGVGTAVRIRGTWVESPARGQEFEVAVDEVEVVGDSEPSAYPLQKKRTSLEHLRTIAHLRPRTNTFQSVFRVRNALAWHIHRYFQERGFLWIHTPIISAADAEGAGEVFELRAGEGHFFGQPSFLTVSGQLQVECFSQAYTDVYTFGPTFRAENSNTARHAAEFWMIEPEMAFADLDDVIALAEDFIREVVGATLEQCAEDFAFFDRFIENGLVDSLTAALSRPFAKVTHAEAQQILVDSGRRFEYPVGPDAELQTEHERFLAEEHFEGPVFVTHYPRSHKAFYMRVDDGGDTVACTDLLVPRIGELIGGSQREERLEVLDEQIARFDLEPGPYWWYRDLRRFGTVPHGGFGLGFERLVMWVTGMKNIRDVLPFPRTPGVADF